MEKKIDIKELEAISGGFTEQAPIATKGKNIKCPNWQSEKKSSFADQAKVDPKTGSVEYHCNQCGTDFVCYENNVILKQNWIALCNKKGYKYPY
ncbi:MAG: hypothetical protein K6F99_10000 [Lachnospiraceae bacterium]|nr:hypothetical protein [Lachnospiraceae bacterium]